VERLNGGTSPTRKSQAEIISSLRQNFKLEHLLLIAGIARSTYFYHAAQGAIEDKYSDIKQKISKIFNRHKGRYGYRRIMYALRNLGYFVNHKLVLRLMKAMGLKSIVRPKKYRSFKGEIGKAFDNVLNRDFSADTPNSKWTTDVTEFKIGGEKLYLSPILDLFNGEIIAFSTSVRPVYKMVQSMLETAISKLKPNEKPLIHSDQGWQYRMQHFQGTLCQNNLVQSMSRKGNCIDNAPMESFFAILKTEMFHGAKFNSVKHLESEIKDYINYYNNDRIKTKLNGQSPTHFRMGLYPTT
jgi:putative transposase